MRSTCIWIILLAAPACGFSGSSGSPGPIDGGGDASIDEGPIDFLPSGLMPDNDTDWIIDTNTRINTSTGEIVPASPTSVTFTLEEQADGSADAAVLRVGSLKINAGVTLSAAGSRPLFILVDRDALIDGTLDVGGHKYIAGPGGNAGGLGPGAGKTSVRVGSNDSGAGGGSFGSSGGAGGPAGTAMSAAGAVYPIQGSLVGGSSGGRAGMCLNPAGGSGGALLIYARRMIQIDGAINASGGGGTGGRVRCDGGAGPGSGGGSGGAIWLQTPRLTGTGILAANGGGGGGGSHPDNGGDGEDGVPMMGVAAAGGTAPANASAGGSGAVQGQAPSIIPPLATGNGGGGGGGLGHIVYRAPDLGALRSSPVAVPAPTGN